MEDFFFKPRTEKSDRDWAPVRELPAFIGEVVDRELKARMEQAVELWIKENPDQMQQAVDDAIRRGVSDALTRTLDERFIGIFQSAVQTMQAQGLLPRPS